MTEPTILDWLDIVMGGGPVRLFSFSVLAAIGIDIATFYSARPRRITPWTFAIATLPGIVLVFATVHVYAMANPLDPSHEHYWALQTVTRSLASGTTVVLLICAAITLLINRFVRKETWLNEQTGEGRSVWGTATAMGALPLLAYAVTAVVVFVSNSYAVRIVDFDKGEDALPSRTLVQAGVDELTTPLLVGSVGFVSLALVGFRRMQRKSRSRPTSPSAR